MPLTTSYTTAEVIRVRVAARRALASWRAKGRDPSAEPGAFCLEIERRARTGIYATRVRPRRRGA